jgi:hypothetical protein
MEIDLHYTRTPTEEWSKALSRNRHVKEVHVCLHGRAERQNLDPLLQVLATHGRTEKLTLSVDHSLPPEVVGRFLHSIQLNPAIHTVELHCSHVSGTALACILDAATSVTTFKIFRLPMEASERRQGAIDLAASMQRNTRIRKLSLTNLDDVYLCPILSSLASNSHVKKLVINLRYPQNREAPAAVKRLLESTSSIESLELQYLGISEEIPGRSEEILRPIAQGLINSESVTDICFDRWTFDYGCTHLFKSVLQSKPNIRSLCVRHCSASAGVLSAEDFIHCLGPDASLRTFELISRFNLQDFGLSSRVEFKALLEAVEKKSELESFSVGRITDEAMGQELVSSIPKMQVRTLQFCLAANLARFKPGLLCAFKANTSLCSFASERFLDDDTRLFDQEPDHRKLKYYAERNKALSQWFTSASSVPREAWPRALAAARVAGPGTVYRILHVMGNSVGPVEGQRKRKRKRPFRYMPS